MHLQLNAAKLTPRQDHTGRRLVRGGLQLAEGTHLLLDETLMRPGQLSASGIINLQVLYLDFWLHIPQRLSGPCYACVIACM